MSAAGAASGAATSGRTKAACAVAVLFAINTMNFFDRQILGAVAEPLRREWGLGDGALGALGTAFTLLYALVGVPLGRWVDSGIRTRILAAGVFAWSVLTALSGAARSFWQLFVVRLGVGVGEATCAPAASSLIGDLFPPQRRSRALSVFMLGLPIGIALSFAVSSSIASRWGWRAAFYVAGLPGLLCAMAALALAEPPRGRAEAHDVGARRRAGSPYLLVLSIPTMWWLILSGALHNFNMYALGAFLSPFLIRFHRVHLVDAGLVAMAVYGLSGIGGLVVGGLAGDAIARRRRDGRLLLAALAILASVPPLVLALGRPRGDVLGFGLLMGLGCGVMYVYYSTVYATLQDVIEPSLRGTAMALYFLAMYVLGASLGPLGTGMASDYFTRRAAAAAGVAATSAALLEPFRAEGLREAMYLVPALGALLTLVLFAGSRTVARDAEALRAWMKDQAEGPAPATAADDPGPVRPGEELPVERLAPYLREALGRPVGEVKVQQFPGGHSNLTYLVSVDGREAVLRRPPFGSRVKSAHDMGREFLMLSRLAPVYPQAPRVIAFCEDESVLGARFYLMERIPGLILRRRLPPGFALDAASARRLSEAFVEALARLHAVEWARAGLSDVGRPDGYVERQVSGWTKRYRDARTDEIREMEEVAAWLGANLPASSDATVVHNDFKYDNLVLDPRDPARVVGLLDWEMSTVGDPLMDLGTALCYWVEPADSDAMKAMAFGPTFAPGSFTRRELLSRYERASGRTVGRPAFYYCFGLFKTAVVIQQIYYRYRQGLTRDPRFASMDEGVRTLARQAAAAMAKGDL